VNLSIYLLLLLTEIQLNRMGDIVVGPYEFVNPKADPNRITLAIIDNN
jgi:hypothetical protein